MTEFLLVATLMWTAPNGQLRSEVMEGVYKNHQTCISALTTRIDTLTKRHGVAPIPSGKHLCAEVAASTAEEQRMLDSLFDKSKK